MHAGDEGIPISVYFHLGIVMVIQAGPSHFCVVKRKAERLNQMQLGAGVGAQADDVAGIRRDFWFNQYDVEQRDSPCIYNCYANKRYGVLAKTRLVTREPVNKFV